MRHSKALLAAAIIKFLEAEEAALPEEKREGLQVAASCIRHSFDLNQAILVSPSVPNLYELEGGSGSGCGGDKVKLKITPEMRERAEQLKNSGNVHLTAKRATEAAEDYTRAIELDPENAVYYSNRAAAFTMQEDFDSAIEDCKAAVSLNPSYAKAYSRLGAAYMGVGNVDQAVEAYLKASELEPSNVNYRASLDQAKRSKAQKERTATTASPSTTSTTNTCTNTNANTPPPPRVVVPPMGPSGGGMDFASLLSNPEIMNMASQMANNPEAMQNILNNPNLASMFQGLMGRSNSPGTNGGGGRVPRPADEEE